MAALATTKMSRTGSVVIPEEVRRRLGLESGTEFVVMGDSSAIVLKPVSMPSLAQFDAMMADIRRKAKRAGLKRSDITKAIRRVRGRR